jgi:hypothetical protein
MVMYPHTLECLVIHKTTGLKTTFVNDGSGAGGNQVSNQVVNAHRVSQAQDLLFPSSNKPIDYDRRIAATQYQTQLWKMHEELPSYGEDKMIRNKYGY